MVHCFFNLELYINDWCISFMICVSITVHISKHLTFQLFTLIHLFKHKWNNVWRYSLNNILYSRIIVQNGIYIFSFGKDKPDFLREQQFWFRFLKKQLKITFKYNIKLSYLFSVRSSCFPTYYWMNCATLKYQYF